MSEEWGRLQHPHVIDTLAIGTGPDDGYTLHQLTRFTKDPQLKHWTVAELVFRDLMTMEPTVTLCENGSPTKI